MAKTTFFSKRSQPLERFSPHRMFMMIYMMPYDAKWCVYLSKPAQRRMQDKAPRFTWHACHVWLRPETAAVSQEMKWSEKSVLSHQSKCHPWQAIASSILLYITFIYILHWLDHWICRPSASALLKYRSDQISCRSAQFIQSFWYPLFRQLFGKLDPAPRPTKTLWCLKNLLQRGSKDHSSLLIAAACPSRIRPRMTHLWPPRMSD
jgi:hypothetical protein